MKHSFWGYFVVLCGVVIVVILLLIQRMTTTSEEDFYLAREVLESSMIDAVDYGTYRTTGRLVMSEQKFVEVFIRRFSESVTNNKTYKLEFYDIYEEPPKASVRVRTSSGNTANIKETSFDVNLDTLVNGILETIYSQADGDSDEDGNGGGSSTITVACPDGSSRNVTPTPNIPDGGGDNGGGGNTVNPTPDDSNLLTSNVLDFYSIAYLQNPSAYNSETGSCNNSSTTGNMSFLMSYKSLPNGMNEDIIAGRIKSCEVIASSAKVFESINDVRNYKTMKQKFQQYLIGDNGGTVPVEENFNYFATASEVSNIGVTCNLYTTYDTSTNSERASIQIKLRYNAEYRNRSSANGNLVKSKTAENGGTVRCFMYTGIKWKLRFKYTRN